MKREDFEPLKFLDYANQANSDEGIKKYIQELVDNNENEISKDELENAFINACIFGRAKTAQYLLLTNIGFSRKAISEGVIMSLINNQVEILDELKEQESLAGVDIEKKSDININDTISKFNKENLSTEEKQELLQELLMESDIDDTFIRKTNESIAKSVEQVSFDNIAQTKINNAFEDLKNATVIDSVHTKNLIKEFLHGSQKKIDDLKEIFVNASIGNKDQIEDIKQYLDKSYEILNDNASLFNVDDIMNVNGNEKDEVLKNISFYKSLVDEIYENINHQQTFANELTKKIDMHHNNSLDLNINVYDDDARRKEDISKFVATVNDIAKEGIPSNRELLELVTDANRFNLDTLSPKAKELVNKANDQFNDENYTMAFVSIAQLSAKLEEEKGLPVYKQEKEKEMTQGLTTKPLMEQSANKDNSLDSGVSR